ncbi:MAG: FtsX-like permease family protein [Bacteroidales bacterium]|nr:FtsX-like permease family protein [Bacteroidales bacterium]
MSELTLGMFGIVVSNPRESGVYAANNGVDFSGLFMALGFFIIIAALLLIVTPREEMIVRRKPEWVTLESLGYSKDRIFHLLWRESWPIVSLSSVIGVVFGIIYTGVVMWLLGNVWKGATNTENFSLYISAPMLIYGLIAGLVVSLIVLRYTLKSAIKEKKHKDHEKELGKGRLPLMLSLLCITFILSIVNLILYQSIALFVVIGILFIVVAAMIGDYYIIHCKRKKGSFDKNKLILQTLYSSRRQNIMSFIVLSLGVFIVFAVGWNRRGFTDRDKLLAGTGGYSLWWESVVPIYHNMSSDEGRMKLAISDLPGNTTILQCLRHGADEASCLNLNKVSVPTVIGVDMNVLKGSDFVVTNSIFEDKSSDSFDLFDKHIGEAYPALVDETVLTWSLVKKLGDTIKYDIGEGRYADVIIAGTIANSVFQGNILVDKKLFSELWPHVTGSEVFLVKCDDSDVDDVKMLLGQAMSQYGVNLVTTNDRLKQFNVVTDTYLTIFLSLGGIGLLLGIISLVVVVRKRIISRETEIETFSVLGFNKELSSEVVEKESVVVPLYAIVIGVIASLLAVSMNISYISLKIWLLSFLFLTILVISIVIFVKKTVVKEVSFIYDNLI